jgi:hypothetical protein
MIRTVALTLAASLAAAVVSACTPAIPPPGNEAFLGPSNTDSPIAGATLRCPQDYPDSMLVFAPDGTLSGRYAGHDVSGEWTALGPGRVEVLVRAGGIAVRDTMRQTSAGWRGENTACG